MGNNRSSILNTAPKQVNEQQVINPKVINDSPCRARFRPPSSCIPSIAQLPIFEDFKITMSEDGDSVEETSCQTDQEEIEDDQVKINEIPFLKNAICLQQLNISNKTDYELHNKALISGNVGIPMQKSTSHQRRNGLTSQSNLISKHDLCIKDGEFRHDTSARKRTILKGNHHGERLRSSMTKGITEKDNETIKSSIGVTSPLKLERLQLENGIHYEGQWLNGKRQGRGIQFWLDGSRYEGMFKNNMANGWGFLTHADGDIYEGQWFNDQAHGFGTFTSLNGSRYVGEWKINKKHGIGIQKFSDLSEYEGQYFEGMIHGKGILRFHNGNKYEGEFSLNEIEGQGIFTWKEEKQYCGGWLKGKLNGQGVMRWQDGSRYIGDYKEDQKHGEGTFQWSDGRRYRGSWQQGLQHEKGQYTNLKGEVFTTSWYKGKPAIDSMDK